MDYKGRFLPQERLLPEKWTRFDANPDTDYDGSV